MNESSDPVDVLRTHVRAVALLERPRDEPDEVVARITSADPPAVVVHWRPGRRRRRRWVVGGTAAVVVLAGAGAAAFVGARPDARIRDVLCRSDADPAGSGVAVVAGADPVGACAALWRSGDLVLAGRPAGVVPRLVACTGDGRPLEVYPAIDDLGCAALGLVDADPSAGVGDPVIALRTHVAEEINRRSCVAPADAQRLVEAELDRLGLTSWRVDVVEPAARCALVSVDDRTSVVSVVADPISNP